MHVNPMLTRDEAPFKNLGGGSYNVVDSTSGGHNLPPLVGNWVDLPKTWGVGGGGNSSTSPPPSTPASLTII